MLESLLHNKKNIYIKNLTGLYERAKQRKKYLKRLMVIKEHL